MTQEQFEKAKRLEEQINHVQIIIDFLSSRKCKCEPPTRMSGFNLFITGYIDGKMILNEGEVVCFIDALKNEKKRLVGEFVNL